MSSRFVRSRAFKRAARTAGSVTFTSTTPVAFDTGTDLTLAAAVGDVIEVSASGKWSGSATTQYGAFDVATIVAGSAVSWFGTGIGGLNYGITGWLSNPADVDMNLGGPTWLTVAAGDLVSGYVTTRLFGWVTTAGSKTMFASAALPFRWLARNLGPVDPN